MDHICNISAQTHMAEFVGTQLDPIISLQFIIPTSVSVPPCAAVLCCSVQLSVLLCLMFFVAGARRSRHLCKILVA